MALVLVGPAYDRRGHLIDLGGGMSHDEVFAPGLAHDGGVGAVGIEVVSDVCPEVIEGGLGAGKVEPGEVLGRQRRVAHCCAVVGGQHVDYAGRQSRFLQNLVGKVRGVDGARGGFPEDGIAHEGRRGGQISLDGGKVEGRNCEHEAFQRAVLHLVTDARGVVGLVAVELFCEVDVETQKVDQLARGINLGLVNVFALAQHGCGVEGVAVRAGNQFGGAKKNGGPVREVHRGPFGLGGLGGLDGGRHLIGTGLVDAPQQVLMVVRGDNVGGLVGEHAFAPDEGGNVDGLRAQVLQLDLHGLPLGRAGGVGVGRFVLGRGRFRIGVGHGAEGNWGKQRPVGGDGRGVSGCGRRPSAERPLWQRIFSTGWRYASCFSVVRRGG